MRYLKKFNESVDSNEVQLLIDNYLSYLKDEEFNINIYKSFLNNFFIRISTINNNDNKFKWDNIKDYIIPFLYKLSEYYTITDITVITDSDIEEIYKVTDIENITGIFYIMNIGIK